MQTYAGLVYWNGYYYYFNSSKTAVKNCSYWVTNTNGLMASASYTFDAQGRMTNPPDGIMTMSVDEGAQEYVAPASATAITTTEEHEYFYAGGKLLREEVTTTAGTSTNTYTIDFIYDQSGRPYAFMYGNVYYYYITNLQGDVMSIVDEDGNVVASYEYDPYGNVIEAAGIQAEINPLRYRGYVYDGETDLYYCQSRYYDPQIGRFINADTYASTGQGIIGNNMFAYCGNNPVNCIDFFGNIPKELDYFVPSMYGGGAGIPAIPIPVPYEEIESIPDEFEEKYGDTMLVKGLKSGDAISEIIDGGKDFLDGIFYLLLPCPTLIDDIYGTVLTTKGIYRMSNGIKDIFIGFLEQIGVI